MTGNLLAATLMKWACHLEKALSHSYMSPQLLKIRGCLEADALAVLKEVGVVSEI